MKGILLLTRAEINRLRRNKRYFLFTIALPIVLYLIVARTTTSTAYGVRFAAYYMVAMASFGAFSGALNSNVIRISEERKVGWIRQLRLTPLPANAYVVAKLLTSLATTIPSVVIVFLLGAAYGHVHLPAWQWIVIGVVVWLGSMIFAALAVAIGYRFAPDQAQPITMLIYFVFTILGGIWFPLGGVLQKIGQGTPTYEAVRVSTDVIGGITVPAGLVIGLVIWLAVFLGLATLSVRSMAEAV
jgi:ABC-2 type transport system permease protein